MNILAIDYGSKNIGLALANTEVKVVLPFGVIESRKPASSAGGPEDVSHKFVKLIKREKIDKLIIGLPLSLDGKENDNTTRRVREFSDALKKQIDIPIEFVDERFSSAQADRSEGGVSRDEKAAMVILQSYLDREAVFKV